jgi:hypothetical protein
MSTDDGPFYHSGGQNLVLLHGNRSVFQDSISYAESFWKKAVTFFQTDRTVANLAWQLLS